MKCYSFSKSPIDFKLIDTLFKSAFNQSLDANYWKWRFLNNPISKKQYINYLLDEDKLVAYYAVSPCEIIIDNQPYKIALSNMTMTHPDYTRRGYFKLLATNLFEELKKDGFIGVFGFANANSHHGFKKNLGWKDLSALNMFSLVKNDFNQDINASQGIYNFKLAPLSQNDLIDIEQLYHTNNSIHLNRSTNWLNWRLMQHPNNDYYALKTYKDSTLLAVFIIKKYGNSIDVMEIFYTNKIDKFEVLKMAYGYLLEKEASQINCWTNLYADENRIMKVLGFKDGEFNTNFGIIPFIGAEEILELKNWHYRFVDSDVF